jgi:hypothetical protein
MFGFRVGAANCLEGRATRFSIRVMLMAGARPAITKRCFASLDAKFPVLMPAAMMVAHKGQRAMARRRAQQ